ncbi:MAG: HAMP domain-containing sensor histidine kinase [Acidobacteriota bacterium]
MDVFPSPVVTYLRGLVLEHRRPAFLLATPEGRLIVAGGDLSHYGLESLAVGDDLGERLLFLAGLFPLSPDRARVLECIQTEKCPPIDVHLFHDDDGDWVILLDASEAESRQRQMQQKGNELSLNYQRLMKETQKKDILLHCIVHDLAGPLMGIRGGFELLGTEPLSDEGRQLLQLGLRQTARQETLIRDILQAFAAEVEQAQAFSTDHASAPDALAAAKESVSLLLPAYQLNGVDLTIDSGSAPSRDWKVVGERSRLERVFSNLIENALRHSPAGSAVTVRLEDDGTHVLVAIEDQGPGVPPQVAGTLFQKFAQGKGKSGKIGLGLYFCRITVEYWGGTIGHEPGAAGGSRFWFRLPRPQVP